MTDPDQRPTNWHPPRAVLELLELIIDGAAPELAELYRLLGVTDLAALARLAEAADPGDVARREPTPTARPLIVEDAEGTPVARIGPGDHVVAVSPFTSPPLRDHRRPPGGTRSLTVAVPGPVAEDDVASVAAEATRLGTGVRWLAIVGVGRGPLPPEGAWRAVRELADEVAAQLAGPTAVHGEVVPVAVPLLAGPTASDVLVAEVARRYAGEGEPWLVLPVAGAGQALAPAVDREVARMRPSPARRGLTVFFTGLSGSGKSTLARALTARLREDGRRTVTLLDGDEVRRLLSAGLGFSRADRDLNVLRVGFVAAEVTRHGGLAVCAPIAPFAEIRAQVRAAVEAVGDLVLVHVATPLAECERRDRKGLYVRARSGEIPEFTGISSPYEEPADADLVVDTTARSIRDCLGEVWNLLEERGYLSDGALPDPIACP